LNSLPKTDQPTRRRNRTESKETSNLQRRATLEAKKKPNGPNVILLGMEVDNGPNSFNLPRMMITMMMMVVMMIWVQAAIYSLEFRSLTT
jgi:hypothetical protein